MIKTSKCTLCTEASRMDCGCKRFHLNFRAMVLDLLLHVPQHRFESEFVGNSHNMKYIRSHACINEPTRTRLNACSGDREPLCSSHTCIFHILRRTNSFHSLILISTSNRSGVVPLDKFNTCFAYNLHSNSFQNPLNSHFLYASH